jgi:phage shock protein PspC (stress-responsive transcriptional regulator)
VTTDEAGTIIAITMIVSVVAGTIGGMAVGYLIEWWLARRA